MRIGLFGGTFNPPHLGHVLLAENAIKELSLDRLLLVPSNDPPYKPLPEGSPSPCARAHMVSLCADKIPGAEVWDGEIKRGGKSYAFETVNEICGLYPTADIFYIMGSDAFLSFGRWKNAADIAGKITAAVALRDAEECDAVLKKAEMLRSSFGLRSVVLSGETVAVSSSEIRAGEKAELLTDEVLEYIADNDLYPIPLERLFKIAESLEKPGRFRHTRYVCELAERLCDRWNADKNIVMRAAVMHDITKSLSIEEHLKIIDRYGIILNYIPEDYPSLLHSLTGAAAARGRYHLPGAVTDCIKDHTLGAVGMSLEAKILFVSDKVEESRPYPDAPPIRALAFSNLDGAMRRCLECTAAELKEKGEKPHPYLYEVLNSLTVKD